MVYLKTINMFTICQIFNLEYIQKANSLNEEIEIKMKAAWSSPNLFSTFFFEIIEMAYTNPISLKIGLSFFFFSFIIMCMIYSSL